MTPPGFVERRADVKPLLFRLFFFGAFAFLIYQLLQIVSPFLQALVIAVMLALVFYPLHQRFLRWFRRRDNLAAGASVAALFFIVVVPMVLLFGLLGQQAARLYPWAQAQVAQMKLNPDQSLIQRFPEPVQKLWSRSQALAEDIGLDPKDAVLSAVDHLGQRASTMGASIIKNVIVVVFQTVLMVFALFFMFRDGPRMARQVVDLIPMEPIHKTHILQRLNETLAAVVRGMFVVASIQGLLAGVGFAVIGVPFSVVLGFLTAFLALIPMVGAAAVWIPVGGFLLFNGEPMRAIVVFLYGGLVVSTIDNILRPYIVGERANLPILLLFFGTLGGLQVYGPIGLLVGPLVVASVLAFAKIYAEQLARAGSRILSEHPPGAGVIPKS